MNIPVLQMIVENHANYLIAECKPFGGITCVLISPQIPEELMGEPILDQPLGVVVDFCNSQCLSNIPFGDAGPFQHGFRYKDFVLASSLRDRVRPLDLIVQCKLRGIKDFHSVLQVMDSMQAAAEKEEQP